MRLQYLLFLIPLFSCRQNNLNAIESTDSGQSVKNNDRIYFINKSNAKLGFTYENKFLDLVQLHLLPDSNYNLFSNSELLLTQTNENQNFYLLYPGDTIYVSVDSTRGAVFSVSNDSIRNNELDLVRKMNSETPLNFWKVATLRERYFDKNYEKLDSIYQADYKSKTQFIDNYKQINPLSKIFEKSIKDYLKSELYAYELWIGTASKSKIDSSFSTYLYSLQPEINYLSRQPVTNIYNPLEYVFARFTLKNIQFSNLYSDSLYSVCKRTLNQRIKDVSLFRIVKEEIKNNQNSSKWFISDYMTTSGNKERVTYLQNIIESSLLTKGSKGKNILLTRTKQIRSLDSLINSKKGKFLYIDFWASWCTPCLAEMPASIQLRKDYQNSVNFMYISIDENKNDWLAAEKQVRLDDVEDSYLMSSFTTSAIKQKFKINTIPRYIIADNKGKIINDDAPRPSDPKLKALFDKLVQSKVDDYSLDKRL